MLEETHPYYTFMDSRIELPPADLAQTLTITNLDGAQFAHDVEHMIIIGLQFSDRLMYHYQQVIYLNINVDNGCAFDTQPEPFMTYYGFEKTVDESYNDAYNAPPLLDYLTETIVRVGDA